MQRPDLIPGALFAIALVAGVAWYGERRHAAPPPPRSAENYVTIEAPPPVEPDPVKVEDDAEKPRAKELVPPLQPETITFNPPPDRFRQRMEPPPPPSSQEGTRVIPGGALDFGAGSRAFNLSQLDQAPLARFQSSPEYPYEMKREGIEGEVVVDFIVDPSGAVRNASAASSSPRAFEEAACRAVSRWKFRPGRKDGHPVFVHMQVPVQFRLAEGP
jgi:protein TonB